MESGKIPDVSIEAAQINLKRALEKGTLKIMSKMGISLLGCYHGAQIFEIYGLGKDVVDTAFRGSVSRIGGCSLDDLEREAESLTGKSQQPCRQHVIRKSAQSCILAMVLTHLSSAVQAFPEKAKSKLEDYGKPLDTALHLCLCNCCLCECLCGACLICSPALIELLALACMRQRLSCISYCRIHSVTAQGRDPCQQPADGQAAAQGHRPGRQGGCSPGARPLGSFGYCMQQVAGAGCDDEAC